ncbi:hypothetical protein WA026_014380 [Henosepilachna vigintioctopunctata]|uniref:Cell wall hydrolase SleB domain-containing protein n=1 Tax=Henosepilachna vigintioctopunctata TaxID=420089 RepID=A0AAW1UBE2_9CUCU
MGGKDIFAKTVYGEARGEPTKGQEWVAWVIKNRAHANRSYWGGSRIEDVCLKRGQFEVWNNGDFDVTEPSVYRKIKNMTDEIYDAPMCDDPTGGCDHYNNPDKEGYPSWTNNCNKVKKIGDHWFYRGK